MRRFILWTAGFMAVIGLVAAYALTEEPDWYVRARYPLHYETIVKAHAKNYDLDPAMVAAVIYAESKFDPATRSRAGAVGLMQLLPETAQGIADRTGGAHYTEADLADPEINVRYGCWYLEHLRAKYRKTGEATRLALAAYNAGQANVDRWVKATPPGQTVEIPYPETRAYIQRVMHLRDLYRRAYNL
jgi:soluble lytic murein transglycosylase